MIIYYKNKPMFEVMTNSSRRLDEILYIHGIDINDQEDLKAAYDNGAEYIYIDDQGLYAVDWDGLSMDQEGER